jgi:hypothetical protein
MANAILQFRRGGSIVSDLTPSEPFFHETNETVHIGTDGFGAYITLAKTTDLYTDADTLAYINSQTVVSSSIQIDHDTTTNYNPLEHFTSASLFISESQIVDLTHYTDTDTLNYINSINVLSGSSQVTISDTTGYTAFSSSISTDIITNGSDILDNYDDITRLYAFTSSIQTEVDGLSAATSSYLLNTTDTLDGDLTVTGTLTAQEFHTEYISSSIIYDSGSTKFGDTADDTHEFTGSVDINGSMTITDTTIVTNLNSDLLDGQHGSYYLNYSNFTNLPTLVSGSIQIDHDTTTNYDSNEHFDHTTISITGDTTLGLSGGGTIDASRKLGLDTGSVHFTDGIKQKLNTETVVSGSSQVSKSLQDVTTVGATSNVVISFTNATNSTTKDNGAVVIATGGLGVEGNINAGGEITAYAASDKRLKNNIIPITNPIEKVQQLSGNTFDWNEELQDLHTGSDIGVIAQEVEALFPSIVADRTNGYKGVQYDKIVPLLIEAIKELSNKVDVLEKKHI